MKIRIVGASGSGKSTLAEQLALFYGVERVSLDLLHRKEDRQYQLEEQLTQKNWIVEGVFIHQWCWSSIVEADLVIYLDLPLYISQWRILRRAFQRMGHKRLSKKLYQLKRAIKLIKWNLQYPQKKTVIYHRLETLNQNVLYLKTRRQVREFKKNSKLYV